MICQHEKLERYPEHANDPYRYRCAACFKVFISLLDALADFSTEARRLVEEREAPP